MMETDQTTRPADRALFRPNDDRVIAGVSSAIARRLSIPTWLVRVVFVILAFSAGAGLVAYAAAWLLIPAEGSTRPAAGELISRIEGPRGWIGIGLLVLAVLVAFEWTNLIEADLALAAILITLGVLLYRGDLGLGNTKQEDTMSETSSSDVGRTAVLETQTGSGSAQPPSRPPVPPVPSSAGAPTVPPPPRQRSILGRLTVAAGLIVIGIMGIFDVVGVADIRARHYFGTAVLIVGLGLLVGSFAGRARGLILLGVVLVPPLLVSPIAELDFENTTARYEPTTVADIQSTYSADIGDMIIDLTAVDFAGSDVSLSADMGFGQIRIVVPEDVSVNATGTVGIGQSRVLGSTQSGLGELTATGSTQGENGSLAITAELGIGQIDIYVEGQPNAGEDASGFDLNIGNAGDVDFDFNTADELSDSYDVGAGDSVFDFSDLVLTGPESVDITADLGSVTIVLPEDTVTEVNASVGVGDISLPNRSESGIDRTETYRSGADPLLTIDVEVGAGEITVEDMR